MTQSVRLLNSTSTGESPTMEDPDVDMERVDLLPAPLRRQLWVMSTKVSAKWMEDQLGRAVRVMPRGDAISSVGRKAAMTETFEIGVFAGEYRAQCGTPYPHVAADASIQRYGVMGPSKHPPRNYGKSVLPQRRGRRRRRVHAMVG